jgi:hypothetical protein
LRKAPHVLSLEDGTIGAVIAARFKKPMKHPDANGGDRRAHG